MYKSKTELRAELESEAKAMHDFEIRMLDLLMPYTTDRAMALRWLHEAEETNGDGGQPDEAEGSNGDD